MHTQYSNPIGNVLENDPGLTTPITIEITKMPKYGEAVIDTTGNLYYAPTENWFFAQGYDYLNYRLIDPQTHTSSNIARVGIDIVPNYFTKSYPTKFFYTPKDTEVLLAEGYTNLCWADGVAYDLIMTSYPGNGKVYLDRWMVGNLLYAPEAGFTGWDKFSYHCYNGIHGCIGMESVAFVYVGEGHPVPEFPTTFLPVTMIIGFLGTVFLIRRTREH